MSEIKAILFDNDGTVADTEEAILISFRFMLEKVLGKCTESDVEKFKLLIGLPSYDQFKEYTSDEDKIHEMLETYRSHNDKILDDYQKNFKGLPEVLEELYTKGYYLGIVTSKRHDICIHGLQTLGIDKFFKYVQGPDDWHVHKPDPGALTHACEVIGFGPEQTLYVGDSTYDLKAGNGAGCKTCAVLWGVFPREPLAAENPDFIISKPEELLTIVN